MEIQQSDIAWIEANRQKWGVLNFERNNNVFQISQALKGNFKIVATAQAASVAPGLSASGAHPVIGVRDSAANFVSHLANLSTNSAFINNITFSDSGVPKLNLTPSDQSKYSSLLTKISQPYDIKYVGGGIKALLSDNTNYNVYSKSHKYTWRQSYDSSVRDLFNFNFKIASKVTLDSHVYLNFGLVDPSTSHSGVAMVRVLYQGNSFQLQSYSSSVGPVFTQNISSGGGAATIFASEYAPIVTAEIHKYSSGNWLGSLAIDISPALLGAILPSSTVYTGEADGSYGVTVSNFLAQKAAV